MVSREARNSKAANRLLRKVLDDHGSKPMHDQTKIAATCDYGECDVAPDRHGYLPTSGLHIRDAR